MNNVPDDPPPLDTPVAPAAPVEPELPSPSEVLPGDASPFSRPALDVIEKDFKPGGERRDR